MGVKSRSNYRLNICLWFDCKNREKMCDKCINYNKYDKQKKERRQKQKSYKQK